jgi:uncharacterized protein (TIGR02679 family)
MSVHLDKRLHRLLGGPEFADLRRRLRRHFERADPCAPPGSIRLGQVAQCEYMALASLMGRPPRRASSIQVDVAQVDAALSRAGIAPSLRDALEALDGVIIHLPTARAAASARWVKVAEGPRHPSLARLLQSAKGLGLLKRLARQDPGAAELICSRAELVLLRLPVNGQPRAQLAAEALGDAHALDSGAPTATLVLAVLRQDGLGPGSRTAAEPIRGPGCGPPRGGRPLALGPGRSAGERARPSRPTP